MTIQEAKKYSWKIVLKGTAIMLFILLFIFMFGETRGDFANGILFFLDAIFNVYFILGIIITFGLSYLFAKKAGEEVILEKQSMLVIAIKYAALIALAIAFYALIAGIIKQSINTIKGILTIVSTHFLPMFLKTLLFTFLIWIWATNKMKSKQV